MSIFEFPRIHFRGTTFSNPGTANNDSLGPGTELSYTSNTEAVQPADNYRTRGKSDAEYTAWLQSCEDVPGMGRVLNSQWNYYGDMGFRFTDVRVHSLTLDGEDYATEPAQDALVGARLVLDRALLCDNNPEGFDTTQIFSAGLELHAPEALRESGEWLSRQPSRACTIRGLSWDRNVSFHAGVRNTSGGAGGAAATFQSVIEMRPQDFERVDDAPTAEDEVQHKLLRKLGASPALDALAALFASSSPPRGLVMRYCLYLTYPHISDPELSENFRRGIYTENPAYGRVLGTLAPWYGEMPESATMGRFLSRAGTFENPYSSRRYALSGIVARVCPDKRQVQLDAINAFPENGEGGAKFDLGIVQLGLRRATPPGRDPALNEEPVHILGELANDQATYERLGGIYTVDYQDLDDTLRRGLEDSERHDYEMVLQTSRYGVLLFEQEYMISPGSKCNYLDARKPGKSWSERRMKQRLADMPPPLRGTTALYVRRRGVPYEGRVSTRIEQWSVTPTGGPRRRQDGQYRYPVLLDSATVELSDGDTVPLIPRDDSGVRLYRFVPAGHFPNDLSPQNLAWSLTDEYFTTQRVLPYEDFSHLVGDELDFDAVYQHIFRNYYLLLPAMNKRLDMSDATIFNHPTAAHYVLRTIDLSMWGSYDYMPRTRDLSGPRRELLQRFCEKVLREADAGRTSGAGKHKAPPGLALPPGSEPTRGETLRQRRSKRSAFTEED
ncbi:hypothetical protein [Haliangium ochraceum]|uniref:Uncharacterized protein n=1 Tax=Haliangium ochraceum (strain DSM 14365 / JCM 11303 / SMP-2) TaxID=502025 RepID=D0LW10_HALO1|nr:hypothetical protein [Haliangium ochraceum]ACY14144.1 hypothetical protein Hoch_1594 [Haliangium ochraceum DSM 14365]